MPLASVRPRLRSSVAAAAAVAAVATLAFAPQALADPGVTRFGGSDRYATAAQTALHAFGDGDRPDTVFIASGNDFPDALTAGAAAQSTFGDPAPGAEHFGSVLLLTQTGGLPQPTIDALDQLQPRRVVVVGGHGAVSNDVVGDLKNYAGSVERWAGDDRYETAAEVSEQTRTSDRSHVGSDHVFVATGENYADAITAGNIAGQMGAPLLLVRQGGIDAEVRSELRTLDADRIVVAGGPGAIGSSVAGELDSYGSVDRASGADRYATAVELAEYLEDATQLEDGLHGVAVASGHTYADALAASNLWEPVLLTQPSGLPASVSNFLDDRRIAWTDIVGGPSAVADSAADQLEGFISGTSSVNRSNRNA